MKKTFTNFFIFFLAISSLAAQPPKREMRATWIATVARIDWPRNSTAAEQKTDMVRVLDSIQSLNMNTVFFQVRAQCDALYNSAYEPWSSDLSGVRGKDLGYDPLAFVLEECHKRGVECHAWLNPYRYSRSGAKWTGANNHPLNYENTHPDWLVYYTGNIILDPAIPEVRRQIKNVVGDLLSKYDLDGIVFDDYFYAYGGTTTQDAASVAKYKPAGMNVHDWRRDNVNRMIADVYDTIQSVRPHVTFGVSPFGIWTTDNSVANKEGITLPPGITGGNMYQEIYCDPVAWMKEGTVDYISPQLYWKIGGPQDYNTLCPWWADLANRFGVHFYSSMANYKSNPADGAYSSAYTVTELANQSLRNRTSAKDDAPGSVFYNLRAWLQVDNTQNFKDFRNYFRANIYSKPSLVPAISWKPAGDQGMVTFNPPPITNNTVKWIYNETTDSVRYAVYAVPRTLINDPSIFSKSEYLLAVSYAKQYKLPDNISTSAYYIAVSVVDRYGNEFSPRIMGSSLAETQAAQLTYPDDYAKVRIPVLFRWNAVEKADCYVWQLATDPNFTDIVCTRETTANSFSTASQLNIKEDGGTYYWRVRTRKANARDVWSDVRRVILSPSGGSGVDPVPASQSMKAWLAGNRLTVETVCPSEATIRIYNPAGQMLSVSTCSLRSGPNNIPVEIQGMAIIRIQAGEEEIILKTLQ
ncbi:MAG: family 10 glycosylhydrolase [Dysgonamonadaceae bacterium]|jgi:uncharacterized lipoprotein YddW (UPF0748 family)|nr:family 10 glycosylhydrolase [Dysgonamonadaceae bacterium]